MHPDNTNIFKVTCCKAFDSVQTALLVMLGNRKADKKKKINRLLNRMLVAQKKLVFRPKLTFVGLENLFIYTFGINEFARELLDVRNIF